MIEVNIINYLSKYLDVEVYMEQPKDDKPASYVIVEKTSGGYENKINQATVAIQSYAKSMYEASKLNDRVKELLTVMANEEDIGSCKLNSDYNFTDISTKEYRYQAVFNFIY